MKFLVIGDPMISSKTLSEAVHDTFGSDSVVKEVNWKPESTEEFWYLRGQVEKFGPDAGVKLEELKEGVKDVDVIVTHHSPISRKLIETSNASYIGVCRGGVENVDSAAAKEKGIKVMRTMGRNSEAVSDYTLALILAQCRNIAVGHEALKQGDWKKKYANSSFMGDMAGKTIGLIGFGYIGKLVARKLSGFDVNVLVYDPFVKEEVLTKCNVESVSLEELCVKSDVISLHARLSEQTQCLIGEKELSEMKSTAYLINTARAGLINEQALISALQERKIGGAALDVFWTEPLPKDHPLLKLDNVTITPHLAGATNDTFNKTPYLLLRELKKYIDTNEESSWMIK